MVFRVKYVVDCVFIGKIVDGMRICGVLSGPVETKLTSRRSSADVSPARRGLRCSPHLDIWASVGVQIRRRAKWS